MADDLSVLRMYRRLGFVSMTLVLFKSNHWADTVAGTSKFSVLNSAERQVRSGVSVSDRPISAGRGKHSVVCCAIEEFFCAPVR